MAVLAPACWKQVEFTRSLIAWRARWGVSSTHWIYLTCPFDKEPLGSASKRSFLGGQLSARQTPKHQSDLLLIQPVQGLFLVQSGTCSTCGEEKCLVLIRVTLPSQDENVEPSNKTYSVFILSFSCVSITRFYSNCVCL